MNKPFLSDRWSNPHPIKAATPTKLPTIEGTVVLSVLSCGGGWCL